MASNGDRTYDFFKDLFCTMMWRDELFQIGIFKSTDDIKKHLFLVSQKINQLNVPDDKKSDFLCRSLHQDVLYELASLKDYETNKANYDWIKKRLEELFGQKYSKVTSYLNVLKVKQLPGQSTRSFLSNVRIHCQKLFTNETVEEKEKHLVMAFINGLINPTTRKILAELKPKTIDEAFSLIKDEKVENEGIDTSIFAMKDEKQTCDCINKVDYLIKKIKELENKLNAALSTQQMERKRIKTSSSFRCYNCGTAGHFARNCRKSPLCKNCGKTGHIAENCKNWSKPIAQRFRKITSRTESITSEPSTDVIEKTGEDFHEYEDGRNNENVPQMYVIQKKSKIEKIYPKLVNNWAQYVEGQGKKPKNHIARTVISSSQSEVAQHKPVIKVNLFESSKNVLLDTGCDSNVIDYNYLKSLSVKNSFKVLPRKSSLKCANGSPLSVIGYTVLPVCIGSKKISTKFTIVEKIFPNVILGMKSMRLFQLSVNPSKECAEMQIRKGFSSGIEIVPFLSQSQSHQEN